MTITKSLLLLAVLTATACGGKHKGANDEGGGGATIDKNADSGDPNDHSGSMVPPEKMEEVSSALGRKQNIMSRCLSSAVEAGNAKKGDHGKITVELTVTTAGTASKVEIVKSTIESKDVQGCVKRHVEEVAFPTLPKDYETSYTYSMEAN